MLCRGTTHTDVSSPASDTYNFTYNSLPEQTYSRLNIHPEVEISVCKSVDPGLSRPTCILGRSANCLNIVGQHQYLSIFLSNFPFFSISTLHTVSTFYLSILSSAYLPAIYSSPQMEWVSQRAKCYTGRSHMYLSAYVITSMKATVGIY
jgi:hypothetical protein